MSAPSGSLQLSDQDLLAKGGHGAVYRCTSNGQQIAVKVFDSATADAAKREVSALQRIGANCPSIVKCFAVGTASTPGSTALSMELATAGDAFKDMSDAGPQGYGDSRRLEDAARALASATSHCHAHGVAHRDIKPENVLMFRDHTVEWPRAKLCDFGAAAIAPRSALPPAGSGQAPPPLLSSRTVGSSQYCAPEIMAIHHARRVRDEVAGSGAPTPVCVSGVAPEYNAYAADVWSWAVTVYVLGSRKVPFKKAHVSDYRFRAFLSATQSYALGDAAADVSGHRELTAREAGYVWKWPGHFSTGLIELLSACMRFRADERPSMGWVLSHRWMCEKEDLCVLKAESSSVAWLSLSPREDTTGDVTFSRGGDGAPSGRGSEHRTKLPPLMTHGAVTQGMAAGESYPLGPPMSPGRSSILGGSIVSRVAPSSMVSQASMFSATSSAAASTVPSHSAASSAASQRLEPVVEAPYSAAADAYRMGGDSRYAQHVRLGHASHTDAAAAAGGVHGGLQKLPVQSVWGEL